MGKTLLLNIVRPKAYLLLVISFAISSFQKTSTTYYVNDNALAGDKYTTAVGNDSNDGTSAASPKLTISLAYEKAQDGDTIIVDTGSYADISADGKLLFAVTKKITIVIPGISDQVYSKNPLPTNIKVNPAEIYIDKDKPVDRETYLQQLQNKKTKKSQ